MSLSNYTELQTAVADWAARSDSKFTGRAADFIRLGEERIWRDLRVSQMIQTATLTIVGGTNSVALPADWLEFKRITTATQDRLEYVDPETLQEFDSYGEPTKYSIEGRSLFYGQTPTADLDLTARYYSMPGYLSDTSTTWLLTAFPSVYLYASLLEGAIFVKNSAKAGEYGTLYDRAINGVQDADRAAMSSGSRLRIRTR